MIILTPTQQSIVDSLRGSLAASPVGPDGRPSGRYARNVRATARHNLTRTGLHCWDARRVVEAVPATLHPIL